jgi:hypothetical protein
MLWWQTEMNQLSRLVPSFKTSLIVSVAVALVGFLFTHGPYFPQLGLMGNVMNSAIYLTDECPPRPHSTYEHTVPLPGTPLYKEYQANQPPLLCGAVLPFRGLMAVLVIFIALCGYIETKRPKPNEGG